MILFISIIFIAELIITFSIINLIVELDKKVCRLNQCVVTFNPLAQTCLEYARCVVSSFKNNFGKIFVFVKKKQQELIYRILIISAIYLLLVLFKIKKKNISKVYKLMVAILELTSV